MGWRHGNRSSAGTQLCPPNHSRLKTARSSSRRSPPRLSKPTENRWGRSQAAMRSAPSRMGARSHTVVTDRAGDAIKGGAPLPPPTLPVGDATQGGSTWPSSRSAAAAPSNRYVRPSAVNRSGSSSTSRSSCRPSTTLPVRRSRHVWTCASTFSSTACRSSTTALTGLGRPDRGEQPLPLSLPRLELRHQGRHRRFRSPRRP